MLCPLHLLQCQSYLILCIMPCMIQIVTAMPFAFRCGTSICNFWVWCRRFHRALGVEQRSRSLLEFGRLLTKYWGLCFRLVWCHRLKSRTNANLASPLALLIACFAMLLILRANVSDSDSRSAQTFQGPKSRRRQVEKHIKAHCGLRMV